MNNRTRYYSLLIFVFLIFSGNIYSQVNDAGLWMNLELDKQINKKFSVYLAEEIRLNENISEAGTFFTEAGGQYKIIKSLSFSAAYRFINKRRLDDSYSKKHRYMLDLDYKYKLHKFNFALRERFQSQYTDINSSEKGKIPENYLRSKLTLKYQIKKRLDSYVAGEFFYQLNNSEGNEFDNQRFTAGLSYKLNRTSNFDLYYILNKEINVKNPTTSYIIGLGYTFSL